MDTAADGAHGEHARAGADAVSGGAAALHSSVVGYTREKAGEAIDRIYTNKGDKERERRTELKLILCREYERRRKVVVEELWSAR